MNLAWLKGRLGRSGIHNPSQRALSHGVRPVEERTVNAIASIGQEDSPTAMNNCPPHQLSAHRTLSRYGPFRGKHILEIGGAQSCDSAYPFLKDGAASVIVTGLDHISEETRSEQYNLRVMRADALKLTREFEANQFDVVYGLSIIEHIPEPRAFVQQVCSVLKPGGLAYFEGDPIWSSPKGHHLWVASWGGPYKNRTSANYLFSEWADAPSTNPLPDWSHLLMSPAQMQEYLARNSTPFEDINCIIDWVFHSTEVNRLDMTQIAEAYTRSGLTVLEASSNRIDVPSETLTDLRRKCGDGVDYGMGGVAYVLAKPV